MYCDTSAVMGCSELMLNQAYAVYDSGLLTEVSNPEVILNKLNNDQRRLLPI
jgi:hypothetical protein